MEFQKYNVKEKKRKKERQKKVTKIIKKKYRYKIDNKYQKAKIKNLEQSLEFQKDNVEEKKGKKERKRKRKNKNKVTKVIKKIYMKFAFF